MLFIWGDANISGIKKFPNPKIQIIKDVTMRNIIENPLIISTHNTT